MSLLGSIAATLSEGIGGGMMANAKWGEDHEAQAKKEAQENYRLQEQMKRFDLDRQSRDKYYADQLSDNKEDRATRAELARLERENNLKIAGMRDHGGGGKNGLASPIKQLEMLDATIRGIDDERARLFGQMEGADPQTAKSLQVSIDALSSQRENLLNSGDANVIWSANGQIGAAHRSQFFAPAEEAQKDQGNIPASLVAPPRAVKKPGDSGGLINDMRALQPDEAQQGTSPVSGFIPSAGVANEAAVGRSYSDILHGRRPSAPANIAQ